MDATRRKRRRDRDENLAMIFHVKFTEKKCCETVRLRPQMKITNGKRIKKWREKIITNPKPWRARTNHTHTQQKQRKKPIIQIIHFQSVLSGHDSVNICRTIDCRHKCKTINKWITNKLHCKPNSVYIGRFVCILMNKHFVLFLVLYIYKVFFFIVIFFSPFSSSFYSSYFHFPSIIVSIFSPLRLIGSF